MSEVTSEFRWNKLYRYIFILIFLMFFVDTFVQIALQNTTMTVLSLIFSIVFLVVIVIIYRIPFAIISEHRFSFFLTPIIRKSIELQNIKQVSENKKKLRIDIVGGKEANVYLSMMNPADKDSMIEALQEVVTNNTRQE
jgi:hypothetical protein